MTEAATAVRNLSDLPSPRGLPLLGNVLQLEVPRLHLILEDWARKFGSSFTVDLGPKRLFVCADSDLLQTVYASVRHDTGASPRSSRYSRK